jgi:hypothetical protein
VIEGGCVRYETKFVLKSRYSVSNDENASMNLAKSFWRSTRNNLISRLVILLSHRERTSSVSLMSGCVPLRMRDLRVRNLPKNGAKRANRVQLPIRNA